MFIICYTYYNKRKGVMQMLMYGSKERVRELIIQYMKETAEPVTLKNISEHLKLASQWFVSIISQMKRDGIIEYIQGEVYQYKLV